MRPLQAINCVSKEKIIDCRVCPQFTPQGKLEVCLELLRTWTKQPLVHICTCTVLIQIVCGQAFTYLMNYGLVNNWLNILGYSQMAVQDCSGNRCECDSGEGVRSWIGGSWIIR